MTKQKEKIGAKTLSDYKGMLHKEEKPKGKTIPKGTEVVAVIKDMKVKLENIDGHLKNPYGPLVVLYILPSDVVVDDMLHGHPLEELKLDLHGYPAKISEIQLKENVADWGAYGEMVYTTQFITIAQYL